MSAYKDTERGTWYCQFRYTDYQGRTHRTTKRGFRTKKEAVKYEQNFRARAGKSNRMTMGALFVMPIWRISASMQKPHSCPQDYREPHPPHLC